MQSRTKMGELAFHGTGLTFNIGIVREMWGCRSHVFSPFLKYKSKRNSGKDGFRPVKNGKC